MSAQESTSIFDLDHYAKKPEAYLARYDQHFRHLRHRPVRVLELGVFRGGSMALWQQYFPNGRIAGLDYNQIGHPELERVKVYHGLQQDTALLTRIAEEQAPDGFDIIIDDCSHLAELTRASFRHLFDNHLVPGGIYVIEDWGIGYAPDWPDGATYQEPEMSPVHPQADALDNRKVAAGITYPGMRQFKSHTYGLPGFIKQLTDELAHISINVHRPPDQHLPITIDAITLYVGQAFIRKVHSGMQQAPHA
ncbi:MAG: hypothetical protein R3301_18785 [Saprospiraceae bacterium]|nr:hypothetical protein [Saprospiraceae bacterium]